MVGLLSTPPAVHYLPLLVAVVISLLSANTDAEALNDYILDYQPLTFNPYHLAEKHERVKRNADPFLRWNFRAYGRTFNLQLQPARSVFAPDHHLVMGDTIHDYVDTSHIYEGKVSGEPSSHVHLSIHNGTVLGFINLPGHNMYHIEPAKKYLKDASFPSIIYPESRMNMDPYRHKRAAHDTHGSSCFSHSLYDKLKSMSEEVTPTKRKKRDISAFEAEYPFAKYTEDLNEDLGYHHRQKRELVDDKRTCFMSLRADGILYQHFLKEHDDSDSKAKEALLSMFAIHISAINKIYENTVFKYKNSALPNFRGVRFQLQRSTIITECGGSTQWPTGYCTDNLDVSNFLDLTSLEQHDAFCLVHTFTYRDFVGGTLGLAWVATPDSRASGVCGVYGRVSDNGKITTKSLNTGITTLINFNQEVASRVSQLTFAHEVGHNFGAQHDETTQCAPYGTSAADASDGNYIMYPSANSGNLPHNNEFSACSKEYIAKVLEAMVEPGGRNYCFKASGVAFCGNSVVEGDEECDCGYEEDCDDLCCNARPSDPNGDQSKMCTLTITATSGCSPSEGPCCNSDCTFVDAAANVICSSNTDCKKNSRCANNNATCPDPDYEPDIDTFCNNHDKVCIQGECIGSVCQNINWTECFMTEAQASEKEEMCYVSCQKDANSECISSFDQDKIDQPEFAEFKSLLETIRNAKGQTTGFGVTRPAGSTCNYGKGYCDIFSKCRSYDAEGPFKQLTDLIFNEVTFENIEEWIVDHWWAVLLMGVGVIIFMAVFVKLFGYNTPSEDPKKKRRAQPMPRVNPNAADKRAANNQHRGGGGGGAGKRGGVGGGKGAAYTTDMPLHDSSHNAYNQAYRGGGAGGYGGGGSGYGGAGGGGGHYNQGYDSYQDYQAPYQAPHSSNRGTHQQFDRIAPPRRY